MKGYEMKFLIITIVLTACAHQPAPRTAAQALAASPCLLASAYGASPAAPDNRATLQAAIDAAVAAVKCVQLEAGQYTVVTPPRPRAYWMLDDRGGVEIRGVGDASVIAFAGDAQGYEWRGLQVGSGTHLHHLRLDATGLSNTNEHSPIVRGDGPLTGLLVDHLTIDNPVRATPGGDCIQLVGYGPDHRITDVDIGHVVFARCARSGIAMHSGVHNARVHDSDFKNDADQNGDQEGAGDLVDIEWDHNIFRLAPGATTYLSLSFAFATNQHIHDNVIERAVDLYSCSSCVLEHNRITVSTPTGYPAVNITGLGSDVQLRDNLIERAASAGPGTALTVYWRGAGNAPANTTVADTAIVQHANGNPIQVSGVVGFGLSDSTVTYDGPTANVYSGVNFSGIGARVTDLHVSDTVFTGPLRAATRAGGYYLGTGSLEISRVTSPLWLLCDAPGVGAGFVGPLTYTENASLMSTSCNGVP